MIFTFLVLLCCTTLQVWAAPSVHKNGVDIPMISIANIRDDPVASDRAAFDSNHQPATRSTPPIYNIPSPNCTHGGKTFAQQKAKSHIDYFCGKKEFWNYTFASPISLGLNYTSDGRKKMAAAGAGYSIPGTHDSVWTGLRFSNDSCSGFFPFTLGNTDEEKKDHCEKRFRAILDGCETDTITAKKEGMLVDGCRVYQITVAKDNPFTVDEVYNKGPGDLKCKDNEKSLKGTCICNYARYPGLTDVFERPASKSCEAEHVDLKKLVIN